MKKGYLRTIEAIIAIIIVFMVIITIMPKNKQENKTPVYIESLQEKIITKIENDEILRNKILEGGTINSDIESIIEDPNIKYNYIICNLGETNCIATLPDNKDIYAKSIMIASINLNKVFRLYLWYEI